MKLSLILAVLLMSALPTFVHAQEEEESGYDSLVKELKSSLKEAPPPEKAAAPLHFNFGAALAGDYVSIGGGGSPSGGALLGGFDIHGGIELTPAWLTEFGFRSFGSGRVSQDYSASLQEYELQLVHQGELIRHLYLRVGGSLSARFLKTIDTRNHGFSEGTDQTPALGFLIGVDRRLTSKVSFGPDLSLGTPVGHGSAERMSADASIRMNFHF